MTASGVVALNLPVIMMLVLVTTTPLKALLEVWVAPSNRAHDAAVQMLALVLGVFWGLLVTWAEGPFSRGAALQVVIAVITGLGGGAAGVGAFHIATTATGGKDGGGQGPPAPPAPPHPPGPPGPS